MIGSPGTGRQHLASRSATSETPSTWMPYSDEGMWRLWVCSAWCSSAAAPLGVLAALALEPAADLRLRARRLRQREPVARGAALLLRRQHLTAVARLQLVVQRHDLAVDLRAYAAVADVRVDLVREVQR